MRIKFSNWKKECFDIFQKPQFELYYPEEFATRTTEVLAISDKQEKRKKKKELLNDVVHWLDVDEVRGKKAIELSAAEVIADLRSIESELIAAPA